MTGSTSPAAADPVAKLMDDLAAAGVELWLDGGSVQTHAPAGALTVGLIRRVNAHQAALRDDLAAQRAAALVNGEPIPDREVERLVGRTIPGLRRQWRENEASIQRGLLRGDAAALVYWRHRRTHVLEPEFARRQIDLPAAKIARTHRGKGGRP